MSDFTATTVLEKFTNQATPLAVERVLKTMSTKNAQDILKSRGPKLPPATFISAYFAAFRPRDLPALPEAPSEGDQTLIESFKALEEHDYQRSFELINKALETGFSWDVGRSEALNLRGTYKYVHSFFKVSYNVLTYDCRFLIGDVEGAKDDLNESIQLVPSFTQSLVKIASVYMEQGQTDKAFECFEEAIKHNPEDPDIYYHRGQG